MKRTIISILLIISMVMLQCSKSDSTKPDEQPPDVSQILPEIEYPSTTGAPLEAQIWITQFQLFTQVSNLYFGQLYETNAVYENGKWKWSFTYMGVTITFYAEKTQTAWNWYMIFNGTYTDPETNESITFNNWKAFEGSTALDGKSGSVKYYIENSTIPFLTLDWSLDNSDNYFATLIVYDETGAFLNKIELTIYSDGSGELKGYEYMYGEWTLIVNMTWDTEGNWTVNGAA